MSWAVITFAPGMKILILSKKFPYPLREGEPIATTYLSRSLKQQGCEMYLLVMNTTKHYFDPKDLPASYNHFKAIHSVTVDNRITLKGAMLSFLRGQSYILSRFNSDEFEAKLVQVLQNEAFDIIQIETPYLAQYISTVRKHSNAKVAMRAHNVEHEIWERVASKTKNPLRRWYLRNQNKQLKKFELAKLAEYDILVAITERDLNVFRKLGYGAAEVVAPVGIDLKSYRPAPIKDGQFSLSFIGALDWMPNQDGLVWFLENVWPEVSQRYSELTFHIAGKNTPDWLRKRAAKNVIFHGEVPDAKSFLNEHSMLVAPLFSGSGIKIKVLEGMALCRAVLTTEIGAEGIPAKHRREFFRNENAADFVSNISYCIENEEVVESIGIAARKFIGENFDNLEIAERVKNAYLNLIGAQ